ncbi:MAG: glycosyltransferase family 2 protein [bacterium]|nr:glycosyltransferase family 2 protein [bacterium]
MKKLIIIPAYNEEECIEATVRRILKYAPEFDYVVINDCSTDNTRKICERNHFNILNLPINLGIGGAVQTGYQYALRHQYDVAVQMDGDGQHDPAYLQAMVDCMEKEGLDMVIGSRFLEKEGFQSSATRRMGIRFFEALIRLLTGKTITDPTSGMRMVDKRVIALFAQEYPKDYPEPESVVTLLMNGMKIKEVPVKMRAREGGVSSISSSDAVYYMVKVSMAVLIAAWRRK